MNFISLLELNRSLEKNIFLSDLPKKVRIKEYQIELTGILNTRINL